MKALSGGTAYPAYFMLSFVGCKLHGHSLSPLCSRREFDVEHKCVEWCKELEEGETIRAQVCQQHWFGGSGGRDRWGLPINIIRFGTADPAGFVREA